MSAIENGMVIERDERRPLDLDSIVRRCKTDEGSAKFVSQICDIPDLEAVIRLCAQEEDDETLGRLIRRTIFMVKVRRLAEFTA